MSVRTRRATAGLTIGFLIGSAAVQLVFLLASVAHAATWASNNCDGDSQSIPGWKRSQAQSYAQKADHEGYEWGGGCYKLNDRDDTAGRAGNGGGNAARARPALRALAPPGTAGGAQECPPDHTQARPASSTTAYYAAPP